MTNPLNSDKPGLSRREAIQVGAGSLLGAAAVLAGGGELSRLAAQGPANVNPTPPPATDPRYPMAPAWPKERRGR